MIPYLAWKWEIEALKASRLARGLLKEKVLLIYLKVIQDLAIIIPRSIWDTHQSSLGMPSL